MRYGSELIVDLGQLNQNFDLLKQITPNNEIIFMVKANAYGHGLNEIVHYAFYQLGITKFGVACVGEAMELRKNFPAMKCELFVFSDLSLGLAQTKEQYLDYNIVPVIHQLSDLKIILEDKDYSHIPLYLKFDTGMHRLGFDQTQVDEVVGLLKQFGRSRVHHLMTHFANSYKKLKDGDRTHRQYEVFLKLKKYFKDAGIGIDETSCANSGAIEQGFSLEESHVRPGLMLYGPHCGLKDKRWQGKTISSFETEVLKTFPIKKGTPIGYGGHVVGKDGEIIYLPLGYGDGILSYYSGLKFEVFGETAQIIGRVNMDLTALFFEKRPKVVKQGTRLQIWNNQTDIVELSSRLKTSAYQVFTAVSSRVPRRYLK